MNKIIYFGLFFMLLSGVLTTVNKCGLEGAERVCSENKSYFDTAFGLRVKVENPCFIYLV